MINARVNSVPTQAMHLMADLGRMDRCEHECGFTRVGGVANWWQGRIQDIKFIDLLTL